MQLECRNFSLSEDSIAAEQCITALAQASDPSAIAAQHHPSAQLKALSMRFKCDCIVFSSFFQTLCQDAVGRLFTGATDPGPASKFWQDLFQSTARVNPDAQQFYCLSDSSTCAIVIDFPRDSVSQAVAGPLLMLHWGLWDTQMVPMITKSTRSSSLVR